MSQQLIATAQDPVDDVTCDPATRVTKSLLGYGVIAGPFYVVVSLAQALTRPGFDLGRHAWSQLALGEWGWIQTANLAISGLMLVAFAVGLRRALAAGPGTRWAPPLIAVYGLGLVASAIFQADPANGFPVGAPDGPGVMSPSGMLHLLAGAIGFPCLTAACLVMARRFRAEGRRAAAIASRVVGIAFLVAFAGLAGGGGSAPTIYTFITAVVLLSGWLTAVAVDRYRRVARGDR